MAVPNDDEEQDIEQGAKEAATRLMQWWSGMEGGLCSRLSDSILTKIVFKLKRGKCFYFNFNLRIKKKHHKRPKSFIQEQKVKVSVITCLS